MRLLLALALILALAACGGTEGDDMPTKPAAMWPLTITAGVNDKIDFVNSDGTYAAAIAPGTYLTPAALAEAVRAALQAAYAPTTTSAVVIATGMNDKFDVLYPGGAAFAATLAAGSYTAATIEALVTAAFETMDPAQTWGSLIIAGKLQVYDANGSGDTDWKPILSGPNAERSGWGTLGFTSQPSAFGGAFEADAATFADTAHAWTVTMSSSGRVTIAVPGGLPFSLKFSTGANAATSARDVLGFGAVDTATAQSVTGTLQIQNCWFAPEPVVDDTGELSAHDRAQTVSLAGVVKTLHYGTRRTRAVSLAFLPAYKTFTAQEGANTNEAIQRLYDTGYARFRWFDDQTDLATGTDYVLDLESAKGLPRNRLSPGSALYSLTLRMRKFV
jgi:hypothetical protein